MKTCFGLDGEMKELQSLKTQGNDYYKKGQYVRAIECYQKGLKLDPHNVALNSNLAQCYIVLKEFVTAESYALITISHQNDSVKGFYRAAKAALGQGKKEKALFYLQKGLRSCANQGDLITLFEEICRNDKEATSPASTFEKNNLDKKNKIIDVVENEQEKTVINEKRTSRNNRKKLRSKSSCVRARSTSCSSASNSGTRSISVELADLSSREPKETDFLDTLKKMQNGLSPDNKTPEMCERDAVMEERKKIIMYMNEGSEYYEKNLWKKALENFKQALEIMAQNSIEVFGFSEMNRVVLKYSISICWIETGNYNNIIQSIAYLNEMEISYAGKFPAIYLGLAKAFYRLNRFQKVLEYIDKGLKYIEMCAGIISHPWPGTSTTIPETTLFGLEESFLELRRKCKVYSKPDAVCRYKECITISSHICPTKYIFYSDPEFMGYVVVTCQGNCKISYHIGCWKHFKDNLSSIEKLSDKDILGKVCLTFDCMNKISEQSVIVRIEVYGQDGKIKSSCCKEPTKANNHFIEHRNEKKKKKNEKHGRPVKKSIPLRVKEIPNTDSSKEDITRKPTIWSDEFELSVLNDLRKTNFGCEELLDWNPCKNYFGRREIAVLETFLDPCERRDSEVLRGRKDFIFTYFYEYLNDEGPQKVSSMERKWKEEVSEFPGVEEFMSQHDGICGFLLQSYRFACIDDYLCLAGQMAETYLKVKGEVGESLEFILKYSSSQSEELDLNVTFDHFIGNSDCITEDNVQEQHSTRLENIPAGFCEKSSCKTENSECDIVPFTTPGNIPDVNDVMMDSTIEDNNESKNKFKENPGPEALRDHKSSIKNSRFENLTSGNILPEFQCVVNGHHPPQMSDIIEQSDGHDNIIKLKNIDTQTDNDFQTEIQTLISKNDQLIKEAEVWKREKQIIILNHEKEKNCYRHKLQVSEQKISNLISEQIESKKKFQSEILLRENSFEAMKKKQAEEISNVQENISGLLKTSLDKVSEVNKQLENQTHSIIHLRTQLRRATEQTLHLWKALEECRLDGYLNKCKERLSYMCEIATLFEEFQSPKVNDIMESIEAWKAVTKTLQDRRELLQVQYDILCQQVESKVNNHCLQLEFCDMPPQPNYPLQDMKNIICLIEEFLKSKNHYANNRNKMSSNNADESTYKHPPIFGNLNSIGFCQLTQPSFITNDHYNTQPRTVSTSQTHLISPNFSKNIEDTHSSGFEAPRNTGTFELNGVKPPFQKLSDCSTIKSFGSVQDLNKKQSKKTKNGCESSTSGLTPIENKKIDLDLLGATSRRSKPVTSKSNPVVQKRWNYEKLISELQKFFMLTSEAELSACLSIIREKNGNKLSGLPILEIISRVEKILEEISNKLIDSMGMDKFGENKRAWNNVKVEEIEWENEDLDKECIICHMDLENNVTVLECKHVFHYECVGKWLRTNSTCPVCRKYTRLKEEFPPLFKK